MVRQHAWMQGHAQQLARCGKPRADQAKALYFGQSNYCKKNLRALNCILAGILFFYVVNR